MDKYGIAMHIRAMGTVIYRPGGDDQGGKRYELGEAEEVAYKLEVERRPIYVTVGNGEHEFRRWHPGVTDWGNFRSTTTGMRWSEWYVDVEMASRRWVYHPALDLPDYDRAEECAMEAVELPEVTRIWIGHSDTGEEFERELDR